MIHAYNESYNIDNERTTLSLLKAEPLTNDEVRNLKFFEHFFSFVYEDFAAIGLQYFYFEKYQFTSADGFIYFNAIFMVVKAVEFATRTVLKGLKVWNEQSNQEKERFE